MARQHLNEKGNLHLRTDSHGGGGWDEIATVLVEWTEMIREWKGRMVVWGREYYVEATVPFECEARMDSFRKGHCSPRLYLGI